LCCSWESFYERSLAHLSSKPANREAQAEAKSDDDSDEESDEDDIAENDDPGTSWFSEYHAPEKVLRFLTAASFPLAPCNTHQDGSEPGRRQPSILDLGTGNGSMLTLLRERGGFTGHMVGVDYAMKSVELARRLVRGSSSSGANADNNKSIRFEVWDILAVANDGDDEEVQSTLPDWFPVDQGGFDIVLDKGTFDAVSLSAEEVEIETDEHQQQQPQISTTSASGRRVRRRICERYPAAAGRLVRPGGFLVVTSCNWTEEELVKWFTAATIGGDGQDGLVVWDRIAYAKFRFGGHEGQGVCTVCFQRKRREGIS
jgi:SAM-dependent methyltransferase